MRFPVLVAFVVSVLAACHAPVGVKNHSIEPDSTQQCASQCGQIGLVLDSVVIMAESLGCVCRPAAGPPSSAGATGAAAGGVAAIMLQQEQQASSARASATTTKH